MPQPECEFCHSSGGEVLWQNGLCRVVRVAEPGYPGFCRVILQHHAKEMTDLAHAQREALMKVVFAVESAVRETLQPDKVNLASLGNMVAHVHWHVVPRFHDDPHFPTPIWSAPRREVRSDPQREAQAALLRSAIERRLGGPA